MKLDYTPTLAMYYAAPARSFSFTQRLLCLLSGLVAAGALALAPLHPLIWVALVPYLAVLFRFWPLGMPVAISASVWFGVPFWLGFFHWFLALHPLTWVGLNWWASLAAALGGWLILGLYHAAAVVLFGILLVIIGPVGWSRLIAPALLWVILEWTLQWGTLGIAVGRLHLAAAGWVPLLQILPWTGSWGLSALIVMVNSALAMLWVDLDTQQHPVYGQDEGLGTALGALLLGGVLVGSLTFYGLWRVEAGKRAERSAGTTIALGVIQGNTKVDEKWQRGKLGRVVASYVQLSRMAVRSQPGIRLIVWPETAIPLAIHDFPDYYNLLRGLARELQVSLHVGVFRRQGQNYFNSVLSLDETGRELGMYAKQRLVPFGEYLPGRRFLPSSLLKINALGQDVAPGTGSAVVTFPFGRVGTLICFESLYPYLARWSVQDGAEALVIVTNDSWYKRTALLPLHQAHAVLRAAETGRYVVRAANTGISSLISPWGQVLASTPIQTPIHLGGTLLPRSDLTFFVRMGDWFVYLAMAAVAWMLVRRRVENNPI